MTADDMYQLFTKELAAVRKEAIDAQRMCTRLTRDVKKLKERETKEGTLIESVVSDVQDQIGGMRLKVIIEGYLTHLAWKAITELHLSTLCRNRTTVYLRKKNSLVGTVVCRRNFRQF